MIFGFGYENIVTEQQEAFVLRTDLFENENG